MIEEIESLKEKLERKFDAVLQDETMLSEWQHHPVTKAFKSELIVHFLESLEDISDVPTCERTRAEHASAFGSRQAIKDILNGRYFQEYKDEE